MKTLHNTELDILFKEMYYLEAERKDRLYANLSIPIAIFTLIFGVIIYYLRNLTNLKCDTLTILFLYFFAVASLLVIFAIYFFIGSFFYYGYKFFPLPSKITAYHRDLKKYYKGQYFKNYEQKEIENLIKIKLNSFIVETYKECLERNIVNNQIRSGLLHRTLKVLIMIIFFLFLSSIPFYIKYYLNPRIQKVEIINPDEGGDINAR